MSLSDLCFIDVETTGLEPDYHELIEVAAIRVHPRSLEVREEFDAKILPSHPERADPEATRRNAYSEKRWADALPLVSVLENLAPVLQDTIVAGHNVSLDWGFVTTAYRRAGLPIPFVERHQVDTVSLAWPLVMTRLIERPTLRSLCDYLGVDSAAARSAPLGVRLTLEVYRKLCCLFDRGLLQAWLSMNADERCIVATVAERIHEGRAQYGAWNIDQDERTYPEEALHEAMDGLSYCAARLVRLAREDHTGA